MKHPVVMIVIKLMNEKPQRINILFLTGNKVTFSLLNINFVFITMVHASAHISAPSVHFRIQFGKEAPHALIE